MRHTSGRNKGHGDESLAVIEIVNRYAGTWQLLLQYREDRLPLPKERKTPGLEMSIEHGRAVIVRNLWSGLSSIC